MKAVLSLLSFLAKVAVFVILFLLALKNQHAVEVFSIFSQPYTFPLSMLLFVALLVGLLLGLLGMWSLLRKRK